MPRTKGKPQLSQARILRAAVKHADKNGIDGLSMRQLAQQLDAGVMSLYNYYASKDELLDAMVEYIAAKIEQPKPGRDWRKSVTGISTSLYRLMVQHPWLPAIWNQRTLGPNKLAYMEALLRVLREGGFTVSLACDTYHAVTAHIEGFSLQSALFPIKKKDVPAAAKTFLNSLEDADSIPYFAEHVQHHIDHPGSPDRFGMMLNMILDGFEARL